MKILRVLTLAMVISLGVAGSHSQASDKTKKESDTEADAAADTETDADDDGDSDDEVTVEKITLARDAGENFEPVSGSFKTTDTFCALVQLSAPKKDTQVKCIWTAVAAGDLKNKKIFEKEVVLNEETLKGVKNPSRIDFSLSHDNPYPVGDYQAEIFLNGKSAQTVKFKIQ